MLTRLVQILITYIHTKRKWIKTRVLGFKKKRITWRQNGCSIFLVCMICLEWSGRKKLGWWLWSCNRGYLAITDAAGRCKTVLFIFCEARCLKRHLSFNLKGWPLIQPTNGSTRTQPSRDNRFTPVWLDHTGGSHVINNQPRLTLLPHQVPEGHEECFPIFLCLLVFLWPHIGLVEVVGAALYSSRCFPYSLLLLMKASELLPWQEGNQVQQCPSNSPQSSIK